MATNDSKIFSVKKHISFYNCDENEQLSLPSYLAWCSEMGGLQLAQRGITRKTMMDERQVFLLSQIAYECIKPAVHEEGCTLKTWESSVSGAKFLRSYLLENEQGEPLCRSVSSWILVDPISRKILRPKEYKHECLLVNDELLPALARIKIIDGEKVGEHITKHSDLDGNRHLNNRHYGKFVIDYAPEIFLGKTIKFANILYINEARLNDKINIYSAVTAANGYCVYGILDNGKKCFEATCEVFA